MAFTPTRRFGVDDVELVWDHWGPSSGVPLVFCHGYTGSSIDFGLQIPQLAADRPVFAVDHRGHGLSTNTGHAEGYTFDRLAEDFATWLDAVTDGPVDLLGHSMGGRLALQVALDHPGLVRSLVLMDTSAGRFTRDPAAIDVMHGFLTTYDPTRGLPTFVAEGMGPEQELIDRVVDPVFLAERVERNARTDPWAFKALGLELVDPDQTSLEPRLGELAVPVTVLAGALDEPLVGLAPDLAASIPGGELVVIEGAFHSPQLTHPEAWSDALAEHLVRADSSSPQRS